MMRGGNPEERGTSCVPSIRIVTAPGSVVRRRFDGRTLGLTERGLSFGWPTLLRVVGRGRPAACNLLSELAPVADSSSAV